MTLLERNVLIDPLRLDAGNAVGAPSTVLPALVKMTGLIDGIE